MSPCQEHDPLVEKWVQFIEKLHSNEKEVPEPFQVVDTLAQKYLKANTSHNSILDVGCETGKNAAPLIKAGHKITLLDIAPNAIRYTQENLEKLGFAEGITESICGKIETLDPEYGPFKAVVGTYAFSFIPPKLFDEVMRKNVLNRIENEGYFAGGFFGTEHAWVKNPALSIVTSEQVRELFSSASFTICEMVEEKKLASTVSQGEQMFHTINVIAQRTIHN